MSENPPPIPNVDTFNNTYFSPLLDADLQSELNANYLQFPSAQGTENFNDVNVSNVLNVSSSTTELSINATTIDNTDKLIVMGTATFEDHNGCEVRASGFDGVLRSYDTTAPSGSFSDGEGTIYTNWLRMIPINFKYTHSFGAEWHDFRLSADGPLAVRIVNGDGSKKKFTVHRTQYELIPTTPTQFGIADADVAKVCNRAIQAGYPCKIQITAYTGTHNGSNTKWISVINFFGYDARSTPRPVYCRLVCIYDTEPGSVSDFTVNLASTNPFESGSILLVSDKGNMAFI
jgi:hypothetical protein